MRILFSLIIFVSINSFAQVDFNNYSTLQAKGEIPDDFKEYTFTKIDQESKKPKEGLKKSQKSNFLTRITYSIDRKLHSGYVVYGDEISEYVTEIAEKLLVNDVELFNKLRFYTLKSNSTNAFSTDQGIIFVTTGLIAQLANEAQLALVLGHEIAHYTQKDVLQGYKDRFKNKNNHRSIEELSQYSKDKELKADSLGIITYKNAGYSMNEVLSTFDVLMYSYLPFDEIEFPKDYFCSNEMYIPNNVFSDKRFPIKAVEDYDDSESSHPNIKNRKLAADTLIKTLSNWGNSISLLGQTKFEYIRKIARYESLRTDIIERNFTDALYSLFILEKSDPESSYLKRMKAQLWLNLAIYKNESKGDKTTKKIRELEGESAQLHFFIRKLSKEALTTLAVRQIYDLKKKNPNDEEISKVYTNLLKQISNSKYFKLDSYSTKTFKYASEKAIQYTDSIKNNKPSELVNESKYDKIKNKKKIDNNQNFDSTKFYLYGIRDVIQDTNFTQLFNSELEIIKEKEKENAAYLLMRRSEKKKWMQKENEKTSVNKLIVVEPKMEIHKRKKYDPILSEKFEIALSQTINEVGNNINLKTEVIDRTTIKKTGTQIYNERSLLMNYIDQTSDLENENILTVDYQLLKTLKANYGTSKVMFTSIQNRNTLEMEKGEVIASIIFFPFLLTYIPIKFFTRQSSTVDVIILDFDTGKVERNYSFGTKEKPNNLKIGAHFYDLFSTIIEK